MKRICLITIVSYLFVLLGSCDEAAIADGLFFHNNSNDPLNVFVSSLYPDTSLYKDKPTSLLTCVTPESSQFVRFVAPPLGGINSWDMDKVFSHDTVIVFILDYELTQTTSWDSIRDNYLIKNRLDIKLSELRKNGWVVSYP